MGVCRLQVPRAVPLSTCVLPLPQESCAGWGTQGHQVPIRSSRRGESRLCGRTLCCSKALGLPRPVPPLFSGCHLSPAGWRNDEQCRAFGKEGTDSAWTNKGTFGFRITLGWSSPEPSEGPCSLQSEQPAGKRRRCTGTDCCGQEDGKQKPEGQGEPLICLWLSERGGRGGRLLFPSCR